MKIYETHRKTLSTDLEVRNRVFAIVHCYSNFAVLKTLNCFSKRLNKNIYENKQGAFAISKRIL